MVTRAVVATVLILFGAQFGASQEVKDHSLTVYGKVRVFAKADRAKIKFDIKGVGSSLKGAFENARAKLDTIAGKLYAIGLDQSNLSTSFFRNEENLGDKAFLSSKKDYRALMVVTITTDKLELLEQVAIVLSEGSIERIEDIAFELINYTQLRKDAIEKATTAAKEKAQLVATTLGVHCGEVLEFEEIRVEAVPRDEARNWIVQARSEVISPFNAGVMGGTISGSGTIYPDEIQFDAEVMIVFGIKTDLKTDSPASSKP